MNGVRVAMRSGVNPHKILWIEKMRLLAVRLAGSRMNESSGETEEPKEALQKASGGPVIIAPAIDIATFNIVSQFHEDDDHNAVS